MNTDDVFHMISSCVPSKVSWESALVISIVIAPFVSAVAIPFFLARASYHWVTSSYFAQGHFTTEKHGRIKGQDYTRWNGKSIEILDKKQLEIERLHAKLGKYLHGQANRNFINKTEENLPRNYPFKTEEDLNWLNRELLRRNAQTLLETDLKMIRVFSKALIPFLGILWVFLSEISESECSSSNVCTVCFRGGNEGCHWEWDEALAFHKNLLSTALSNAKNNYLLLKPLKIIAKKILPSKLIN